VLTQLLAELDAVRPLGGVVVVAATSRIDLVDPSVLRPGRLGTHVRVDLPDEADRRAVLEVLLRDAPFASTAARASIIAALAKTTEGFSGASLRQLVDEAKLAALRGRGRPVLGKATFDRALDAVRQEQARPS
jgi:ATP-dependent Zn protease